MYCYTECYGWMNLTKTQVIFLAITVVNIIFILYKLMHVWYVQYDWQDCDCTIVDSFLLLASYDVLVFREYVYFSSKQSNFVYIALSWLTDVSWLTE